MQEGRAELQKVILHYEKQRAEAMRAKQEAEIVLPFMRAALEELDAAVGQTGQSNTSKANSMRPALKIEPTSHAASKVEVDSAPLPTPAPQPEPALAVANGAPGPVGVESAPSEPAPAKPAFGRASIASLIEEASGDAS